ncbi:tripartite tricarboxylate transporter substrate binding protein [Devosia sp. BSSL-BM10]|uniref:Tripartite tricarboxylate transporter substrate binding protein n=1 Tax=Devosia litorisediminis TaxID=2829817 RepID=A0A942I6R7_9HYPH|nr:tripartite tricarboxylate transporter substrate binding protein [Devosia litorisediminis]MBS3849772.1 tripartite tricarboxylate transporter substrate binding protein [Devosia litorisediminis]
MKTLIKILALTTATLVAGTSVHAQEWRPNQPVRMVVAFAAGGPVDLVAREFAPRLEEYLGQPVLVENMGGAGGLIAAKNVGAADADGQTIFFAAAGNVVIRPLVDKDSQVIEDLRSVALVSKSPHAMVVNADLPVQNVDELIALAKERPGELNFGSAGTGAAAHLGFEMFKMATGVEIEHIPYSGVAPSLVDLAAGAIDMSLSSIPSLASMLDAGLIRIIGLTDEGPGNEDIPLISDTVPDFGYSTWYGAMVPVDTSDEVVQVLNDAFAFASADEDLRKRMALQGLKIGHSSAAEMDTFFQAELVRWGAVIDAADITAE